MPTQTESAQIHADHVAVSRRLHGAWRWSARIFWLACFTLMLVLNIAAIVAQVEHNARGRGVAGLEAVPRLGSSGGQEFVLQVDPQGPAAQAGIQQGDLLIAIEGIPVQPGALYGEVNQELHGAVGASLTLTVQGQDGVARQYTLTLVEEELIQAWRRMGVPVNFTDVFLVTLEAVLELGWLFTAALIFWRRSYDWLALVLSLTLVLVTPQLSYNWLLLRELNVHWAGALLLLGTFGAICTLPIFYLLPDGHFVPRWTAALAIIWVVWRLAMEIFPSAPFSIYGWPDSLQTFVWLGCYGTGIYAQVYRYQHVATPLERQQIKWVAYGLTIAVLVNLAWSLTLALFPIFNQPGLPHLYLWLIGRPLYFLGMMLLPVCFGIAAFRYRLWEIDLIINRTLVYGALTALVAGLIGALSSLFQVLFMAITGSKSDWATVLAALIVGAAITPLQTALQELVDKTFKVNSDPAKRLAAFQEQVQHRLNPLHFKMTLRRLLHESVTAFASRGGAIYWGDGIEPVLAESEGEWTGEAVVRALLQTDEQLWGYLALGPRRSQRDYSPKDNHILQETARVVAIAIEEDKQFA